MNLPKVFFVFALLLFACIGITALTKGSKQESAEQLLTFSKAMEVPLEEELRSVTAAVDDPNSTTQQSETARGKELTQIVAVDPFHHHDANAMSFKKVLDGKQIVVLDQSDFRRDLGDTAHGLVIRMRALVVFRRKDLHRNRNGETVGATIFGQIHFALAATAEQPQHVMVARPADLLSFDQMVIPMHQTRIAGSGRRSLMRDCGIRFETGSRFHRLRR